jgi:hypothetical protein
MIFRTPEIQHRLIQTVLRGYIRFNRQKNTKALLTAHIWETPYLRKRRDMNAVTNMTTHIARGRRIIFYKLTGDSPFLAQQPLIRYAGIQTAVFCEVV